MIFTYDTDNREYKGILKLYGQSYLVYILHYDTDKHTCDVNLDDTIINDVPISEIDNVMGCRLPWRP